MRKRILLSVASCVLITAGCSSNDVHVARGGQGHHGPSPGVVQGGPPAHAPAHGYRRKFQYRYYADACVYHDADRGLYFWIEGEDWRFGAELPSRIVLGTSTGVVVELEADAPYEHYASLTGDDHNKQHPGKGKAKGKESAKARRW